MSPARLEQIASVSRHCEATLVLCVIASARRARGNPTEAVIARLRSSRGNLKRLLRPSLTLGLAMTRERTTKRLLRFARNDNGWVSLRGHEVAVAISCYNKEIASSLRSSQ
jgi:hypothetical protein